MGNFIGNTIMYVCALYPSLPSMEKVSICDSREEPQYCQMASVIVPSQDITRNKYRTVWLCSTEWWKLWKKNELLLNLIIDCPYFVSVYDYHLSPRLSGGCNEECYPHTCGQVQGPQDGQVAPCCDLQPQNQQEAASTRMLRAPWWRSQLPAAMVLTLLVIGNI